MSLPPGDLDFAALDQRGLKRLARAMGLWDSLQSWQRAIWP
jgi:hypothetical protein